MGKDCLAKNLMNSKSIAHLAIHETVATLRYICCHADHPIFPIWMLWYFSQVKIRAYDEKGFTTLLQIDPQWDLSGSAWQQTFKLNWKAKNSTCLLFQFLPSAIFCIMFSLSLNSESIFELSNFFAELIPLFLSLTSTLYHSKLRVIGIRPIFIVPVLLFSRWPNLI